MLELDVQSAVKEQKIKEDRGIFRKYLEKGDYASAKELAKDWNEVITRYHVNCYLEVLVCTKRIQKARNVANAFKNGTLYYLTNVLGVGKPQVYKLARRH